MGKGTLLIVISLFFLATAIYVSAQVCCVVLPDDETLGICNYYQEQTSCPEGSFISDSPTCGAEPLCELGCCCINSNSLGDRVDPQELVSWEGCFWERGGYSWLPTITDDCDVLCGDTVGPIGPVTAPHCFNGLLDSDEVGVDCGGADCAPCPTAMPDVCSASTVDADSFVLNPLTYSDNAVQLTWTNTFGDTCTAGEVSYFVMRREAGSHVAVSSMLSSLSFSDPTAEIGNTYFYKITAIFPDGAIDSDNEEPITIEDQVCTTMPENQRFCYQGDVFYCNNLGLLTSDEICTDGICVESATNAGCVAVSCEDCNRLYGVFGYLGNSLDYTDDAGITVQVSCDELVSLGACVFDVSNTVVDYYSSCSNEGSCLGYNEIDTCNLDPCRYNCQWRDVYGVSGTLGIGACVAADDPILTCEQCNSLPNCGQSVCSSIGPCYWTGDTCVATEILTCNHYGSQADCENGRAVSVRVQYSGPNRIGGDHLITESNDGRLGRCYWDWNACFKDADGIHDFFDKDDCAPIDPDYERCSSDFDAPTTTILMNPTISAPQEPFSIPFTVIDNAYDASEIDTYYCISQEGDAPCYPTTLASNQIPADIVDTEITVYYYSTDGAKNLELVRNIVFNTDATPPVFLDLDLNASPQVFNPFTKVYTSSADVANLSGQVSEDATRVCVENTLAGITQCVFLCPSVGGCIEDDGTFWTQFAIIEQSGVTTNDLAITVMDAAGNSNLDLITVEKDPFGPDAPSFSIESQTGSTSLTPWPNLLAEFSEDVTIVEVHIDNGTHELPVTQTPESGIEQSFEYLSNFLENGDYTLVIVAMDYLDNTANSSYAFTVEAPFIINRTSPEFGFSDVSPYDIEIRTSKEAHCSYSLIVEAGIGSGTWFDGENENSFEIMHTIAGATWANDDIYITCRDVGDVVQEQMFTFTVDTTESTIDIEAIPNPVIDPADKHSLLIISADDPTVCWVNDELISENIRLQSSYLSTHTLNLSYADIYNLTRFEFDYDVRCRNLAALESVGSYTVAVELTGAFVIEVLSPESFISDSDVVLSVRTPITTTCTYNGSQAFEDGDRITHTKDLGSFPDGQHEIDVECRSAEEIVNTTVLFTLDTTAPTNVSITASDSACAAEGLSAEFSATDNIGVAYYNYSLRRGSTVVVPLTRIEASAVNHKLNMTEAATYIWEMLAVDVAGNSREASDVTVQSIAPDDDSCDEFEPSISFNVTGSAFDKDVEVICIDDQSGCDDRYNYSINEENENCIVPTSTNPASQKIPVVPPKRVCVWMSDNNGNQAFEEVLVEEGTEDDPEDPDEEDPDNTDDPDDDPDSPDDPDDPDDPNDKTPSCGDGEIDAGEACDGANTNGLLCDDLGTFLGGSLRCDECKLDTTRCIGGGPKPASCGDGLISPGESCDGSNIGGIYCRDLGFAQGLVTCDGCKLDTSLCKGKQVEVDRPTQTGPDKADSPEASDPDFDPFDFDPGEEPEPEKKSKVGIIMIILGLLMSLGGGGYLGYKKYYGGEDSNFDPTQGPTDMGSQGPQTKSPTPRKATPKAQPKQPTLDDIRAKEKSKLLSDVRKKQKKKERDKLFDAFDEDDKE